MIQYMIDRKIKLDNVTLMKELQSYEHEKNNAWKIRKDVFYNNLTTEDLLLLSKSYNSKQRIEVGYNPNTSIEVLFFLSDDSNADVRRSILRNENTPIDIIEKLSRDSGWRVRRDVALNTQTPHEILLELIEDTNDFVFLAALSILAPKTNMELLAKDN